MAKLAPKDPQFGIPVASRLKQETAIRFNKEAEKAGKTLSLYLSEYVEKAIVNEKKITELTNQLNKERELTKKTVSRFIVKISKGEQEKATQLIETYNTILKDEKSK